MNKSSVIVGLLLVSLLVSGGVAHTQPQPGVSTGTAIGNAIKTAITTAFPAISTIISAIWPGNNPSNKKKTDATTSTADLQKQSTQALAQLNTIASDLDTVTTFLANCVVAEDNVIAMRTYLKGKTSITDADKLQLQQYWNDSMGPLATLASAGPTIDNVSDTYIRTTLRAVVNTSAGPTDNVTNELNAGVAGLSLLSDDLVTLDSQLSAANALAAEIIGDVSLALKAVKNAGAGAQGETKQTPEQQNNIEAMDKILKSHIPELQPH